MIRLRTLVTTKLLLLTMFLLCFKIATAGEFTVMPGHSLGRIWLDAPHGKVRKIMGSPYLIKRDANLTIEFWRVPKSPKGYVSAVFDNGRVIQLETNSSAFSTPHGVSALSNLGRIRKIFPKIRVTSFGSKDLKSGDAEHNANYYDSVNRGIAFELDFGVRPDLSDEATSYAVVVHRRNHQVLLTAGREIKPQNAQK